MHCATNATGRRCILAVTCVQSTSKYVHRCHYVARLSSVHINLSIVLHHFYWRFENI